MRRAICGGTLVLCLLARGLGYASEASVTAQVTSEEITLDETVQLTVMVNREAAQPYQGFQRPDLKDWELLSQAQGEATQFVIVNGHQSVRTMEQHVYLLRPRHRGFCTIPPAVARVGGREVRSREISVRVLAGKRPGAAASPDPAAAPLPEPEPGRSDEEVFVEARADRATAYVGEQLVVSWSLFARSDILRYRATQEPRHEDFWSDDLVTPPPRLNWVQQTVKGQPYQAALLLKKALFPLKAGRLTITPLEIEATTMETMYFAGASALRSSKAIVIDVLPLPVAGRPPGFEAANVGRFAIASAVDRRELKAGEALTFRVTLRGEGNLRNVKPKRIEELAGFKVYEPTVTEKIERGEVVRGERVFSYLLLPSRGGELALPAVELPYFDPHERKYAVAAAPGLTVKVAGDPARLGGGEATRENVLAAAIRPLRNVHRVESRLGERVVRGPLLWVGLAAPPSLLLLAMVGGALRSSLVRETARSRRRRARRAARRRLREAELHMKGQRTAAFFTACARALYDSLEVRLGTHCEALTQEQLRQLLASRGGDGEITEAIVRELELCDFARFAPSAQGPGEMKAALRRASELVLAIEHADLAHEVA